jgi:hypothetical protein
MNTVRKHIDRHQWLNETCHCSLEVGSPVTVDGFRGRGVVTRRNGRKLTVQFRSELKIERDMSFVHPIGKTPGEV